MFGNRALRTLLLFGWLVAFYTVPEGVAVPYTAKLGGGSSGLRPPAGRRKLWRGTELDRPRALPWRAVAICRFDEMRK